ncbi:cytochrome P450 [Aspergillus saccharolyticus JOP 1030-1]|uniref:Cytochrome P450 monooxygenase n=1 Tax=Aspergillus saccharolyticus JOP 1030-1 TaxID=1450539 RepID=A0A319A9E2_9EURO|nr:cytochrome P450 monooxygenase [Aspergillus saccharolyticus JOP 1030-1]PYH43632.1 cytochrome P450 monooxygenase [Aspergillus saccharolyticus JOP 1030-1]
MIWFTIILGLLALSFADSLNNLFKNVRVAQRSGLPYVVSVISPSIAFMAFFNTPWFSYMVEHWLPARPADIVYDTLINFRWRVKDRQARRYGDVYLLVSPKGIFCSVADAAVVSQVVHSRQSFTKPIHQYKVLDMYGPNVVTCEDAEWAHHRRFTATTFNEKNNALVWRQAIQQTHELIEYWRESQPDSRSDSFVAADTRQDTLKLSLNVLTSAGYGVDLPFKPLPQHMLQSPNDIFKDTTPPPSGFDFTFRAVMSYMNEHITTVAIANNMLPKWIPRALVPFFKQDFAAHRDLELYLHKLIEKTECELDATDTASDLVQGMLLPRKTEQQPTLTDREVISNLHIITIAGHETTATTLRFAFLLLALHPDVQVWMYEDLVAAIKGTSSDAREWDYGTMFPKLVAPLCVMLETMRLYPPVTTVPKWTGDSARTIHYHDRDYILEPRVNINLNAGSLHYSEKYWGRDADQFHPQRWDLRNEDSFLAQNASLPGLSAPGLEYPTIHKPVRGAYIAFSDGMRACLGKKFSQVEFVIALAVIFKDYRVELAHNTKEGVKEAERSLRECTSILTLALRQNIPLRFHKR